MKKNQNDLNIAVLLQIMDLMVALIYYLSIITMMVLGIFG